MERLSDISVSLNQFTQLLIDFGCDVTKTPTSQFELGVLWIQYSWAVFLLGFGIKSLTKFVCSLVGGRVL